MPDSPDLPSPQDADGSEPVTDPDTVHADTPTGDAENASDGASPDDPDGASPDDADGDPAP